VGDLDWKVKRDGHAYRVRAVKRGDTAGDNTGVVDFGTGLIYLLFLGLLGGVKQYKVAVLRESAIPGLDVTQLKLLYQEILPKDADPKPRAQELRRMVLDGHFDGWTGRRKSLDGTT
jgi:hypothetical protein